MMKILIALKYIFFIKIYIYIYIYMDKEYININIIYIPLLIKLSYLLKILFSSRFNSLMIVSGLFCFILELSPSF